MAGIKEKPFKTTPYPLTCLEKISMDFSMDLPFNIKLSIKVLLIITDQLNKRVILILISLIFTLAVATAFIKWYVPYHGFLRAIINNKRI